MIRSCLHVACLVALLLGSSEASQAASNELKTLEIGDAAPEFALPGVDGRTYTLADFARAKVLVVIFTCNHCPTAQAYEDRIIQLHAEFKDRGVALVAISPNDPKAVRLDELGYTDLSDSLEEMKIRARDKGFAFPYLYDGQTQKVSRSFGVLATPHVFVFDVRRRLRYVGRIDDSDVGKVKSHDTRNAIEALLAGEPVPVETTRVFGCSTKWSDKRESAVEAVARWNAEPVSVTTIGSQEIRKLAKNDSSRFRLVNVWATWCAPCLAELPEFVTINRMYRKRPFEMITISVDNASHRDKVLSVLTEMHVSSTNYIFDSDDRDKLAEALDRKWRGPLPYTVLVAPGGEIVYRRHGPIDPLALKKAIVERLGRTYASR